MNSRSIRSKRDIFGSAHKIKQPISEMVFITDVQMGNDSIISSPENIRLSGNQVRHKIKDEGNTRGQPQPVQANQESILIGRLSQIMKDNPINMNLFLCEVGDNIEFSDYIPNCKTILGANVLSNGLFHRLWGRLLRELNPNTFKQIQPRYLWKFQHAIRDNYAAFAQIWDVGRNTFLDEPTSGDLCQLIHEQESQLTTVDFPAMGTSESVRQPEQIQQNQDEYIRINHNLLKNRQNNESRRAAEMTCLFLRIDSPRTFSEHQVRVTHPLEVYIEDKFSYAVFLGRLRSNSQGQPMQESEEQNRIFISCYKLMSLEQLMRVEYTYGQIFGFVGYHEDSNFLHGLYFLKFNSFSNKANPNLPTN